MSDESDSIERLISSLMNLSPDVRLSIGRRLIGQSLSVSEPGRWCYTIMEGQTSDGQYVPSVVVENESGHRPLLGRGELSVPWRWGSDFEKAKQIAAEANEAIGVSPEDAIEIVASSIRAGNVAEQERADALAKLDGPR